MSDWTATHSTSIGRGLDQEMPGGKFLFTASRSTLMQSIPVQFHNLVVLIPARLVWHVRVCCRSALHEQPIYNYVATDRRDPD
jgi:hypothetical protein